MWFKFQRVFKELKQFKNERKYLSFAEEVEEIKKLDDEKMNLKSSVDLEVKTKILI